ncbi:MAG: hypothetical protein AAGD07_10610 [Planctomycetota bacterium]
MNRPTARRYRDFLRYHAHVSYPETSERREQINVSEVIHQLDEIGMSHIDVPVIWDAVHLIDDGTLATSTEIRRRVRLTYQMRMWAIGRWVDGYTHRSIRDAPLYLELAKCLREVEFDWVRGRTDIDRALANVAIITTAKRSLAEGLPAPTIATQINWALEQVEGLDHDEVDLLEALPEELMIVPTEKLDPERMAEERGMVAIELTETIETRGRIASLFSACFGGRKRQQEQKQTFPLSVRRLDVASRLLAEPSLEALMRVSRIAKEYVAFQPRFEKKMIPAPDGDQTRMRVMESFGELPRLAPASWALKVASPKYFRYRLATKSLMVREKIKRSDKKQLFYAMLDRSKSMQQGERIYKLLAILLNRLRAVARREATLGYSFFDSVVHEEIRIDDASDARDEISRLQRSFFVGDDTDINLALREGIKRIREAVGELGTETPELIIVTDGDHGINVTAKELKHIMLHVFIVEERNEDLMRLARETGGVALQEL